VSVPPVPLLDRALVDHRRHMQDLLAEIVERGGPLTPHDAESLVEGIDASFDLVRSALARQPGGMGAPEADGLLRHYLSPRIGRLRQHGPRPVRLPASYLRGGPPEPAPTISIVTPSFGQAEFIERTIGSVVGQRYPALEYVVQDGGSTDGTVEILRRWEPRLASWLSERDGGQSDAINRGFERTTGEIMGWLNSDDLLLPGALAYVSRYFAEHPEADVVYGHRIVLDEHDQEVGTWILPKHDDTALLLADYVPQETLFWRRRIWERAGGLVDPAFSYAMDWDLLLRFRAAGAVIVRLPRYLGGFRVHDRQKTTALDRTGFAEVARLRRRSHGRYLSTDEVLRELRPYLRRHVRVHLRQRLLDHLPKPRVGLGHAGAVLEGGPLEPSERAGARAGNGG
jgi:glycosyltransferase involved in cell wall biosynthesis